MEDLSKTGQEYEAKLRERLATSEGQPSANQPTGQSSGNLAGKPGCPACGGNGYVRITEKSAIRMCRCRTEMRIEKNLAKIPARFAGTSLETWKPKDKAGEKNQRDLAHSPFDSFYLWGAYGTGKTHLAYGQYRVMVAADRPCLFASMADLLMELRRADNDNDYFCLVRDRVRYAERFHLFIDDVDKFKVTEFGLYAVFELMNRIYDRNLGLTITSNLSLDDLANVKGMEPGIVRRIDEICVPMEIT